MNCGQKIHNTLISYLNFWMSQIGVNSLYRDLRQNWFKTGANNLLKCTCVPSQADRLRFVLEISSGCESSSLSKYKFNFEFKKLFTDYPIHFVNPNRFFQLALWLAPSFDTVASESSSMSTHLKKLVMIIKGVAWKHWARMSLSMAGTQKRADSFLSEDWVRSLAHSKSRKCVNISDEKV